MSIPNYPPPISQYHSLMTILTIFRHCTMWKYALVSRSSMTCVVGKMERRRQMMTRITKKIGTMMLPNSLTLRLLCTLRSGTMWPEYVHPTTHSLIRSFTHLSWIWLSNWTHHPDWQSRSSRYALFLCMRYCILWTTADISCNSGSCSNLGSYRTTPQAHGSAISGFPCPATFIVYFL